MDFEALLLKHAKDQRLQPQVVDMIKRDIARRLLFPSYGRLTPYANVFLLEWEGNQRIPVGARLGQQMIVWTQDGAVHCVGPDYVLKMPPMPVGGHIEMFARSDAKHMASYERLADYVVGKPSEPQKQIMIIGTDEASATHPDGSPCREVRRELAVWLGIALPDNVALPNPQRT